MTKKRKSTRKLVSVKELREGDRFNFWPRAWHGPSVVLSSSVSGELWRLDFSNPKIVNPPGRWYGKPDSQVMRLKSRKKSF